MCTKSTETTKLLIFQYFLYQEGLLMFLRNHQFNWSKYELNTEQISQNPSLNCLINPSFQGAKRLFVLSIENPRNRKKRIQELLINLT